MQWTPHASSLLPSTTRHPEAPSESNEDTDAGRRRGCLETNIHSDSSVAEGGKGWVVAGADVGQRGNGCSTSGGSAIGFGRQRNTSYRSSDPLIFEMMMLPSEAANSQNRWHMSAAAVADASHQSSE